MGIAGQSRTCLPAVASTRTAPGSAPSGTAERSQTTPRGRSAKASRIARSRSSTASPSRPATSRTTTRPWARRVTRACGTAGQRPADRAGLARSGRAADRVGHKTTWWSKSAEESLGLLDGCTMTNSIRWSRNERTRATEVQEQHEEKANATCDLGWADNRQYTHNPPEPSARPGGRRSSDLKPHRNDGLGDHPQARVVAARVPAHALVGLIDRDRFLLSGDPLGLFDDDP